MKLTESFVGEMSQLSIDVIQEDLTKTQPAEKRIKDWITSFGHPLESGWYKFYSNFTFDDLPNWQLYSLYFITSN